MCADDLFSMDSLREIILPNIINTNLYHPCLSSVLAMGSIVCRLAPSSAITFTLKLSPWVEIFLHIISTNSLPLESMLINIFAM